MKGISPIIATILLIVMTVGISALMYGWLSGMFATLQGSTETQIVQQMQRVDFSIPNAYLNTNNIQQIIAVVYNSGDVVIDSNKFSASASVYEKGGGLKETVACTPSGPIIPIKNQATVTFTCPYTTIKSLSDLQIYYITLTVTYANAKRTATISA